MALVAGKIEAGFQLPRSSLEKIMPIHTEKGIEPPRKKQKTSGEFCFSLDDLNRHLYSRDAIKTYVFDDKIDLESTGKDAICFWCDAMRTQADFKCPYHGTISPTDKSTDQTKQELPYAFQSIPKEVKLCTSSIPGAGYGIQANTVIPAGAWIGPYEGTLVKPEDAPEAKTSYMWEIFKDSKLFAYIDGSDENTSSWMRFIRCARHKQEQNMFAFQYLGKIYYRVYENIPSEQELLVWYDDKYTQYMGLPCSALDGMAVTTSDGKLIKLVKKGISPQTPESAPCSPDIPPVASPTSRQQPDGFSFPTIPQADPNTQLEQNGLQLQTTFQKIGALQSSPPKLIQQFNGFSRSLNSMPDKTNGISKPPSLLPVSPLKPTPKHSARFLLKITDGHVTSPTRSSLPSLSPSLSPLSTSPTTPNSIEGFRFESQTSEPNGERQEVIETSLWRCGQCKKTFAQRTMLQIHVCARVPNKPYQCGHCSESFALPRELRTHAFIHQGRKPFKCGYCSRSFSGATTLNNHIRTHTGEKPFDCEKCGKHFTQGSQLSRHQRLPGDCVPKF